MKRTLTAAATLLAGSAGVVGFAGTAAAADTPQLPAELPMDNSVAQTAYHAAGTMHSATKVVGDVVPAPDKLTGRSAQPPNGGGPLGGVGEVLGLGGLLGGGSGGALSNTPLSGQQSGDQQPGGQQPGGLLNGVTGRSGADGAGPVGQLPVGGDLLQGGNGGPVGSLLG